MSWSVLFIGKPENVVKALQAHSETIDGPSKQEFDSALPHLIGLGNENFNHKTDQLLRISANGHGYEENGQQAYRTCNVQVEPLYGTIV